MDRDYISNLAFAVRKSENQSVEEFAEEVMSDKNFIFTHGQKTKDQVLQMLGPYRIGFSLKVEENNQKEN